MAQSHDWSPLSWTGIFDECRTIEIPVKDEHQVQVGVDRFQVYQIHGQPKCRSQPDPVTESPKHITTPPPSSQFLSANVSSNSPTSPFTSCTVNDDPILYVFHHGGGHSSLSFAQVAQVLKLSPHHVSVLCFDCRGHGNTETLDSQTLSLDQLADDMIHVIQACYPQLPPEIVLVGHSLGGAVVVEVAKRCTIKNVIGVAVLDVVEGSAMDSLQHMQSYLSTRPHSFETMQDAIKWSVQTRSVSNVTSARISIPSQLKPLPNGKWTWKTNLACTQKYWQDWFRDLSNKFLTVRGGKLLVLAGTDRLDKALTIGQMQGKYQLIVYPESGHNIQEDVPDKLSTALIEFWKRNQPLKIIKRFPLSPQ